MAQLQQYVFSQEQKYEGNSWSSVGCFSFGIRIVYIAEPLNSLFFRKHICSFGNIYSFSWESMLSCTCFFISSNTHRSQDYNPCPRIPMPPHILHPEIVEKFENSSLGEGKQVSPRAVTMMRNILE